jgi:hypothetical protein
MSAARRRRYYSPAQQLARAGWVLGVLAAGALGTVLLPGRPFLTAFLVLAGMLAVRAFSSRRK